MKLLIHSDQWDRANALPDAKAMHLDKFGVVHTDGHFRSFFTVRDYYYLHFIEKGRGSFLVDGVNHDAPAGTLIFFFPGVSARYHDEPATPWRFVWARLYSRAMAPVLRQLGITRRTPCTRVREPEALQLRLHNLFHRLRRTSGDAFMPYWACWELLMALRDHLAVQALPLAPIPLIEQAQRILDDPVQPVLNVEQLAQKVGVGRVTLFRLFRDQLHTTPAAHIDEVRNRRALFMLSESNLGLKEIAASCGLSSAQYFSSWFVRKNGAPPSAYRRRLRRERGLSSAGPND